MQHKTEAIVVTCIDFRLQHHIEKWLGENLGEMQYDRVALAGGVFDFDAILKQVEISSRLHDINKAILMNHEDCGAYGAAGTKEKHIQDLMKAESRIEAAFAHLDVETYYLHLDGTFEQISQTNPRDQR